MPKAEGSLVLSFIRSFSLGCVSLALLTGAALAQGKSSAPTRSAPLQSPAQTQNSQAPAPVSSEPETTTASYGSWTLRCQRRTESGTETRFCQVEQNIVPQGQQNPIAQVAIGRPSPKEELRVTAVLPANVIFPSSAKISDGDKDAGVELIWRRCLQGGCIADNFLKEESLRNWRSELSDDTGHLVFTEASGRPVNIQFSFRGFAQAMDAFAKEK
jgi:invasion protein IalB